MEQGRNKEIVIDTYIINQRKVKMVKNMLIQDIKRALEERTDKSAWNKAVTTYALELVEEFEENYGYTEEITEKKLLNGTRDWNQYSWGGCSLIYDCDIAERTCSPSELKKTCNGNRRPNKNEEWLDVQARALYQAYNRIMILKRSLEVAR